jgi:hypothetical protein
MQSSRSSVGLFLILSAVLGFTGCGRGDLPELGSVTGTVTMDSDPVANIVLLFKPDVGRAATATTDDNGFYRLEYVKGVTGTKLGSTIVLLEWPLGFPAPFTIPSKYTGVNTELKLDVQKGKNTFDIKMVANAPDAASKGKAPIATE